MCVCCRVGGVWCVVRSASDVCCRNVLSAVCVVCACGLFSELCGLCWRVVTECDLCVSCVWCVMWCVVRVSCVFCGVRVRRVYCAACGVCCLLRGV